SNCSQCLQAGKGCAYCSEESAIITKEGSMSIDQVGLHLQVPLLNLRLDLILSSSSQNQKIEMSLQQSQVSPQQVTVSLLPGEERLLNVEVFAPKKGPLDLYILMDFSNSMADDLSNLKKMGEELGEQRLSDDYTIGFGKFVDKVIEPQTDMRPAKLKEPWPQSDPPFAFQSVIKLTNNVSYFQQELQKERISGNLDAPEGGFDAILQAAVCGEKIGWRQHSTHLLVFSTESAFHYEADGVNVLSGILPRNDEQCHLDKQGKYTHETSQDYPSIPTLVRLLGKHNIIPIFAVTNYSYSYYEYFPIAEVGLLQDDSSNILQVMEEAFKVRACRGRRLSGWVVGKRSSVLPFWPSRVFAQRTVDKEPVCKMNPSDKEGTMRVKPTTFNAAVSVKASVLCPTCACEQNPIKKSDRCHRNGDLVCGKCQCHDGWLGNFCNCSTADSALDANQCIGPGMTQPCSGRGDCQPCGTCVCYNPEQFEGPFCQYDRTQCQRRGGFLCNGTHRGSCVMGRCACTEGWEGDACDCTKSNQTCVDSRGGICSGLGTCECGRCTCSNSSADLTVTCEPSFQLGACDGSKKCAQCKAWKTGEEKDKCDECVFKVELVDELKDSLVETHPTEQVSLQPTLCFDPSECPPGGLLWLLPLLLFLLLLLALLLLCCWKYCACCASCWQVPSHLKADGRTDGALASL
uniref:Integrin beta n=1 Tax=Oryzias melastigma TaxID=30732 RepID=A0A3B3BV19_ORYME